MFIVIGSLKGEKGNKFGAGGLSDCVYHLCSSIQRKEQDPSQSLLAVF